MAYPGPYGQHPGGYPAAGPPGYPQPGAPPGGYGPSPGYPGAPPPAAPAGYAGAPAPGGYGGAPPPGGYGGYPGQYPVGVDPQVAQWFQTVDTDRSGRITANELQKALVNANWTQFNPETCRLMIGMFDRDMSGTIDINEFQSLWHYIQQWRGTFERYDHNRSGSIEGPELLQAYRQMGYNVSQRFADTVVYKFDFFGKRSLSLDNFIQSCVMLKSLSDAFRQRDTTGCGTVQMPYEDFLTMAVLYKP